MNERYQEDLDYFLNFAESERGKELDKKYPNESMHLDFYFLHSKNELKDFINTFLKLHKINDDYDFYYFMNCIIKYMGGHIDAHTRLIMSDNDNAYPLSSNPNNSYTICIFITFICPIMYSSIQYLFSCFLNLYNTKNTRPHRNFYILWFHPVSALPHSAYLCSHPLLNHISSHHRLQTFFLWNRH